MEIIKTIPGDDNFHLFKNLPKLLYPSGSIRLLQKENINTEFLYSAYVLLNNNRAIARAALYKNPSIIYNEMNAGCIGNYECMDDLEASQTILSHVIHEAKSLELKFMIGPMNGSTWDSYRFSQHKNVSNFLLEPEHHLYYNEHFMLMGFKPISTYISSIDTKLVYDEPEIVAKENDLIAKGVKIRDVDMNKFEDELKKLYPFISTSFKSNFLYTPISWETFRNKYMEAVAIINSQYFLIAEDAKENIIAFVFCYDDLFNTKEKSLVIKTLARDASQQWIKLGQVLINRIVRNAKKNKYDSIIHAFMIEQGASSNTSKNFFGTVNKNYILYGRTL